VADAEADIEAYCRRSVISQSGAVRTPSARQRERAYEAVDRLIALTAEKPAAAVTPGVHLRLAVGDIAEDLQGSNCDPGIIAALDQGLARIPPP
jgi:hypothetical protein